MSWAHCGQDSEDREIGYAIEAFCDHTGCTKPIDRGLAYACGGMHGDTENSCEQYFCEDHRDNTVTDCQGKYIGVCAECHRLWEESGGELDDDEE